jgi:hypothetical protein
MTVTVIRTMEEAKKWACHFREHPASLSIRKPNAKEKSDLTSRVKDFELSV